MDGEVRGGVGDEVEPGAVFGFGWGEGKEGRVVGWG